MRMITLYIPESYLESLDQLVESKLVPSRAEAIRLAVRDFLKQHGVWKPVEVSSKLLKEIEVELK